MPRTSTAAIETLEQRTLFSTVTGLTTSNALITFDTTTPGTIDSTVTVTGLQGGENLLGIDFRPEDGLLYGVGSTSRLYTINTTTGAATQVGSNAFGTALNGTDFGVDFNPVADRLRVVSDADQNLRINPNDGTVTSNDTALAYAGGDPNNGVNPNVIASAYTNNFPGASSTTLYAIDSNLDVLAIQNPPNNGSLNTVGALGVNATAGGFDITGGPSVAAIAGLVVGGVSNLYTINLSTGAATLVGAIGGGGTIRDVTSSLPGALEFSAPTYTVSEAGTTATITVNRTGGTTGTVAVNYATSDGTADVGDDYTAASGTLTFLDGETSKTFNVAIDNDTTDEPNETINLTLTSPTNGAVLGADDTATLTITDNDDTSVDIGNISVAEGNTGTTNATFTVTLSVASSSTVTVDFSTSDGTAIAGSDYTAIAGQTVTFSPGDTSQTVTVLVNGDTTPEFDEAFTATLSNVTGAQLGDSVATGTIVNDDSGAAEFDDPGKAGQKMVVVFGTASDDTIRFERSGGSNSKVAVFLNDVSQGIFNKPRKLIGFGLGGDDLIRVNSKINRRAVLVGDAGVDVLIGGKGKDILIGGDGVDGLFGRGGQDVLIGSQTDHDDDVAALSALSDSFNSSRSFATRVSNLQSGTNVTGNVAFNATTITDDNDRDILTGDDSRHLFFTVDNDVITDQANDDVVVSLVTP